MDDHSPAGRDKREPDPSTAADGARNRAASAAMPDTTGAPDDRKPPGNATGTATPTAQDGGSRPDANTARAAPPDHRSGNDERQRGWFWHWNGIITQFAPLIGLKGVGLLNSYTVWTDRREGSPHRGYAFPSQQSEANFYGEDRAELITINKILVALDLIEVRKEMVLKVDEQGRRWRVPHNFYRVKDRPTGLDLTAADVIRVIELAERDTAVYRYIRKVFSSKFEPIDRDNVWHRILPEIASHPSWQRLAEKAARQEARASARTRAGHKSRNKPNKKRQNTEAGQPEVRQIGDEMTTGQDTSAMYAAGQQDRKGDGSALASAEDSNNGSPTSVHRSNRGSEVVDEETNNGSTGTEGTTVATTNKGEPGIVEPGNTTYYESSTTTTTTDSGQARDRTSQGDISGSGGGVSSSRSAEREVEPLGRESGEALVVPAAPAGSPGAANSPDPAGDRGPGGGASQWSAPSTGGQGPVGDPSPLVVSLFEAANDRRATPLERILLSELERDAAAPARAAGSTGADWVAAALREAVGSGSAFVAPKRVREIINRWAAEGAGPKGTELARGELPVSTGSTLPAISQSDGPDEVARAVLDRQLGDMRGEAVNISSVEVVQGGGGLEVLVSARGAGAGVLAEQRSSLERDLSRELGQPVTLRLFSEEDAAGTGGASSLEPRPYVIAAGDAARGRQLWLAVLDDLSAWIPPSDLTRLRDVTVLGQGEQGEVYLGTSNRLAGRYLAGRYHDEVQRSVGRLLGSSISVVVLEQDQWRIGDPSDQ